QPCARTPVELSSEADEPPQRAILAGVDGIALGPGDGERLPRGARFHRVLAELPELEAVELRFGPEFEGVEPHVHPDQADTFYVLDGEAEFTVGETTIRV